MLRLVVANWEHLMPHQAAKRWVVTHWARNSAVVHLAWYQKLPNVKTRIGTFRLVHVCGVLQHSS